MQSLSEKTASVIVSVLLILVILISTGQFFCASRFWFEREFRAHENEIADELGFEEAVRISCATMDYLLGNTDSLAALKAAGSDEAFYNNRELHHLEDCRGLFTSALMLRNAALIIAVIGLIILLFMKKAAVFARSYIATVKIFSALLVVSVVAFAAAFDRAFDWIHELLFDNYLWIMNPVTDDLVRLMTTDIITETAGIILTTGICLALFLGKIFHRRLVPTENLLTRIRMLAS